MAAADRPVVVAYDGSAPAQEAVKAAATLFSGSPLVVVTVWEGINELELGTIPDASGIGYLPMDPERVTAIDRTWHADAADAADAGARIARELGASVEPVAIEEGANVAETIVAIADQRDAKVVVIGSRGHGRVSGMFGSTSLAVLRRTALPVLVIRAGG
jgi:nucleotide-binding universal stress UspA family protein